VAWLVGGVEDQAAPDLACFGNRPAVSSRDSRMIGTSDVGHSDLTYLRNVRFTSKKGACRMSRRRPVAAVGRRKNPSPRIALIAVQTVGQVATCHLLQQVSRQRFSSGTGRPFTALQRFSPLPRRGLGEDALPYSGDAGLAGYFRLSFGNQRR
jgi:hypothetical protein